MEDYYLIETHTLRGKIIKSPFAYPLDKAIELHEFADEHFKVFSITGRRKKTTLFKIIKVPEDEANKYIRWNESYDQLGLETFEEHLLSLPRLT